VAGKATNWNNLHFDVIEIVFRSLGAAPAPAMALDPESSSSEVEISTQCPPKKGSRFVDTDRILIALYA
jgi:hypothetical protein